MVAFLRVDKDMLRVTGRREVEAYTAHVGDRRVDLWLSEGRLLTFLMEHTGRTCHRHQIRRQTGIRSDNGLDNAAQSLRRKLGPIPGLEIQTVRGVGYRLEIKEEAACSRSWH